MLCPSAAGLCGSSPFFLYFISYSLVQLVPLLLLLMAFFLLGVSVGIGHGAERVCRPLSGLSETSVAGSMFTLTTTTHIKETGIIFLFLSVHNWTGRDDYHLILAPPSLLYCWRSFEWLISGLSLNSNSRQIGRDWFGCCASSIPSVHCSPFHKHSVLYRNLAVHSVDFNN